MREAAVVESGPAERVLTALDNPYFFQTVWISPEQSTPQGVTPPHWYGLPPKNSSARRLTSSANSA